MSSLPAVSISRHLRRVCVWAFAGLVLLLTSACLPFLSKKLNYDVDATTTALQATINGLANAPATAAQASTPTPQPLAPTLTPLSPASPPPQPTFPPAPTAAIANLEDQILNSNVLLYEDSAGNPEIFRFVLPALERMGFRASTITDTGDAQGRLMDNLRRGAPNGKPWDLIIIAAENRSGIQGTFFEILEGILNRGNTSVILETWYLDSVSLGAAKPVLLRCGVDVTDWMGSSSLEFPLFAYDASHPLLNEVMKVDKFRITDYWAFTDIGDWMYLTGTGDAKLVVGTKPEQPQAYGVLAECMNGRLILQTMSSHNYTDDTVVPLWTNYIHYALRKHFGG